MRTLHLTLKKKWFDMILSGEKKEEYREIKQYWVNRLTWHEFHEDVSCYNSLLDAIEYDSSQWYRTGVIRQYFDTVTFRNGYSKDAPTIVVECLGITYDEGRPEWGAVPREKYFVIKLGEILKTENA